MKLEGTKNYKEIHAKLMRRPGFKEAYEELEPEFAIYDAIMAARIQKHLTQKELAKKIGVTQSALARFESGKISATLATLQKFCKALGLKIKIVEA